MSNLAIMLVDQGQLDEAVKMKKEVLERGGAFSAKNIQTRSRR
jgi:hypothetical protein